MKNVRIEGFGPNPHSVKVRGDDGQSLTGITKMVISIEPGQPITAEITQRFRVELLKLDAELKSINVEAAQPDLSVRLDVAQTGEPNTAAEGQIVHDHTHAALARGWANLATSGRIRIADKGEGSH